MNSIVLQVYRERKVQAVLRNVVLAPCCEKRPGAGWSLPSLQEKAEEERTNNINALGWHCPQTCSCPVFATNWIRLLGLISPRLHIHL